MRKVRGKSGRGRCAVSAHRPNTPMIEMVKKAVGILRSWDLAIDLFAHQLVKCGNSIPERGSREAQVCDNSGLIESQA